MYVLLGGVITASADINGLPLTRIYPLEEIDGVSQGGRLCFDRFGRVAVVQDGAYVVLSNNTWTNIAAPDRKTNFFQATFDGKETTYYGALGDWGELVTDKNGNLYPRSLAPKDRHDWVATTNFSQIFITPTMVYFAAWNGVAAWNPTTKTHKFFAVSGVAKVFALGDTVYVSSHVNGMLRLDNQSGTLVPVSHSDNGDIVVNNCAAFSSGKVLLSSTGRYFYQWDNGHITPFPGPLQSLVAGPISALQPLAEGDVAVAIINTGVFIVGPNGQIKMALTGANYGQVKALAANEPGVLWVMTEAAVQKIFYQSPFTVFNQSLGIVINWPQLVSWNDQLLVASNGHLYEVKPRTIGQPSQFVRVASEPGQGTWGIATFGPWLLGANAKGVFAREPGGSFKPILDHIDAVRLATTKSGICFVLGEDIAALRCNDGRWEECAPRIKGVGFPAIVHAVGNSVWIELGANRVARITLRSDKLETRVFDSFPWAEVSWVNVSPIGDLVVLAGPDNQRLFFDEQTEAFTDAPELKRALDACPSPAFRLAQDDHGIIWASLARGIVTLTPSGSNYLVDSTSYEIVDERVPIVHTLPDQDIWVSTGVSLYHVDTKRPPSSPADFQPVPVSIRDSRTNTELLYDVIHASKRPRFSAKQNSLSLTFFAGSYRSRHPPRYEFKLDNDSWKPFTQGSDLILSDLFEGDYTLEVRLVDDRGLVGTSTSLEFSVEPPWYRTWYAYIVYPIAAGAVLFLLIRYFIRRARAHNEALEKLVAQRTNELKTTMDKLHNETINSAMLAERNRLANEIHDSLEQGFTGLQFQLETTANFNNCSPEIKSSLAVALNMVAYSRNEVRHTVRNLHAPILDTVDLETAVRRVVGQITPQPSYATVTAKGKQRRLGLTIEHHLLRIAQEAITNAVKHSKATHVEVDIAFREHEVLLSVTDNGCGFDPTLKSEIGHFGLPSLRSRASAIGGILAIDSCLGKGTLISARIPLQSSST